MTPNDISCELRNAIKERLNQICSDINNVDKPDFYVVPQNHMDWVVLNIPFPHGMRYFVVTPSPKFKQAFFNRRYLRAVADNPELFGTGSAEDVLQALKNTDNTIFPSNFTLVEFKEYIQHENMAYVIEITDGKIGTDVLRIDLFQEINDYQDFKVGLFHSLKHFTIEEYESISKDVGGYKLPFWDLILLLITKNFYCGLTEDKGKNRWTSIHEYDGKYAVGGYFKKNGVDNLYIFNTIVVKKQQKLSAFEKRIIKG